MKEGNTVLAELYERRAFELREEERLEAELANIRKWKADTQQRIATVKAFPWVGDDE